MAESLLGRTLLNGEYQLTGILGRGGMATVYRAYSRALETDVAVKVLSPRLASDPGFRERHHDEARSLAHLHHPNLVEVHHYGEEGDLVYIVMRLVPGGTLKNRLEAVGAPLDVLTTARLVAQVADALQLAHGHGLVHLDMKPANILLGRSDWPLLADFGITRAIRNVRGSGGRERMAGTPLYMSPEQCRGEQVDGRSDQYSLAVTAYEMLTGHRPFQAETTAELLQRQIEEAPPRPRELNAGIPGPVEDVLLRALSKAPDDRFPSIRDFAAALTDAAERTRGVSLETKEATASIAPNLVAVLTLILAGPVLFSILPPSARIASLLPLTWPFQLVLSALIAGLLLGVRWQVIGLLTRGVAALLDSVTVPGVPGRSSGSPPVRTWRQAAAGSVQGIVNLIYLFVIYRLIAAPALEIASHVAGTTVTGVGATVIAVVVIFVALGIITSSYRSSGAVVAALTLAVCWAFVNALPIPDVTTPIGVSLVWTMKAFVGAAVLAILLLARPRVQAMVRRVALAALGRPIAEFRPGASPDEVKAAREHLVRVVAATVDVLYLLAGYALLRTPVLASLQPLTGFVPAAILISGAAALVWLLLTLRLNGLAGLPGFALGILLGAPLIVSFPLLDSRIWGVDWLSTGAAWVVGTALILVLAAMRGRVQDTGLRALGPVIDRHVLGTSTARTEDWAEQRARALGGVAAAMIDVAFLILVYWILVSPAAYALDRITGRSETGSILLVLLVITAMARLLGPLHHAVVTVEESGGARFSRRLRSVSALLAVAAALVLGGCAATPLALAAPAVTGGLALEAPVASTVVVDWEHWIPWTPARDQATYDLSLSCSDGRKLGQFREAIPVPRLAPMPSGNVGRLGPTDIPCDRWTTVYFSHRQEAGLSSAPSASLDWLDVRASLRPDRTADVVETHRVLFTSGSYQSLSWSLTEGASGEVSDVQVFEDGDLVPLNPRQTSGAYAIAATRDSQFVVSWWFPTIQSPAERVFTIKYRLKDAVRPLGSGYRFERQVLPPDRIGPAWRITVEVVLPGEFESSAVHLSANGVASEFGMADKRTASFSTEDVPTGSGLDVVVDFPGLGSAVRPPVAPTPTPTSTPNLTATVQATRQEGKTSSANSEPGRSLSALATSTPSVTSTPELTATPTPTASGTPTPVDTATATPTVTATLGRSFTATATPTSTATRAPAAKPSATATPTSAARSCAPVPVLAMYYAWYDLNTWTSGKTSDQPVTPYVSADRTTIERQVTQAQAAGIDGFELNWWGPGNQTDTNLQTLLDVARSHGFKIAIDFDLNSPFVHSAGDVLNDLTYLKRYLNDPTYFRYNGKPYVVFYGTRKYDVATWGSILRQVDPNHQVLWIAEGDIFSYLSVFDGIHAYSVAWSPNPSSPLASYASRTRSYPGKIWMATVMPGYNDKLVNGAQGFAVDRQNGAYYTTMWAGAIATNPDVVSITSFNEWVEGSYIEPSKSYGDLYLQLTRQMVTKYQNALKPSC